MRLRVTRTTVLRRAIALVTLIAALRAPVAADELAERPDERLAWLPGFSTALGYHYSVGDYGLSRDTEVMYVPLLLRAEIERWSLQLTLPYLHIRGPAGIFGIVAAENADTVHSSDGFGDILLDSRYTFDPWLAWLPYVGLTGQVKFPTASESQGLGTGSFDYGLGVDLSWSVGRTSFVISGGRRFLGNADDYALNDVFTGSGALIRSFADWLDIGVMLDYQQPSSDSSGNVFDVFPYVSWRISPRWALDTYASFGLASGSPTYGSGLQLTLHVWQP